MLLVFRQCLGVVVFVEADPVGTSPQENQPCFGRHPLATAAPGQEAMFGVRAGLWQSRVFYVRVPQGPTNLFDLCSCGCRSASKPTRFVLPVVKAGRVVIFPTLSGPTAPLASAAAALLPRMQRRRFSPKFVPFVAR